MRSLPASTLSRADVSVCQAKSDTIHGADPTPLFRGALYIRCIGIRRGQENRSMDKLPLTSNPFALMMHPEDVIQAMERSERLGRLQRRICKPLDKPVIPRTPGDNTAQDRAVEDSDDIED
ncbi:MAG: hypothetical protein ACJ8G7_06560 [Rhizobacter sp.]